MNKLPDSLRPYRTHGVFFSQVGDKEAIGNCVFCDKNKLYVNIHRGLWSCKVCGEGGTISKFLDKVGKENTTCLVDGPLKDLSRDRKLPPSIFKTWDVGWNGKFYTIPTYNFDGKTIDLRCYEIGKKVIATPGAKIGLLGGKQLLDASRKGETIYVCEGEGDTFALDWLLRQLGESGIVVGTPGASIFKNDWIGYFSGRNVQLLYDKDDAGINGEARALERLKGVAKKVCCLNWPNKFPDGFDVRDFLVRLAIEKKKPKLAWKKLQSLFTDTPRLANTESETGEKQESKTTYKPIKNKGVYRIYGKWLKLHSFDPIKVLFGTIMANKLQGDPVWVFIVAPPGGMKSELIMSLSGHPMIESTTSLTPAALISGSHWNEGRDPSLIARLDGRLLAVKDFTTVMTMNERARDEIFGSLRDAFDGKIEKIFGTGVKRSYKARFGLIAGVTPAIEAFGVMHRSLGERFLKIRITGDRTPKSEEEKIRRAISNINTENTMREELQGAAARVIDRKLPKTLPTVPDSMVTKIIALAQFCSSLRGVVDRDRWSGQVQYKPMIEIGTRLAKQLMKLALGIAIFEKKSSVSSDVYRLVKNVALDTSPDRIEEIVWQMHRSCPKRDDSISTKTICKKTRLPTSTVYRLMQDLELLRLVYRVGHGNKFEWSLTKRLKHLIERSEVYAMRKV